MILALKTVPSYTIFKTKGGNVGIKCRRSNQNYRYSPLETHPSSGGFKKDNFLFTPYSQQLQLTLSAFQGKATLK